MGVFFQPEWANFVCSVRTRPWQIFGYTVGLSLLVFRRFSNTLYIRLIGKGHRGLKRWPEWLATNIRDVPHKHDELAFPSYSSQMRLAVEVPRLRFEAMDAEGHFAAHRWGNCFVVALAGEAAGRAALDEALFWIRNAPAKEDAAWETYSSCERVVNLAVMLSVHPEIWRNLDAGIKREVAGFFAESVVWITNHLEYYGIERTNNHILNNARALVVAGVVLGDELTVERGLLLFSRMAKVLFQPEGFLRERSSHYQNIVTIWLLDALHFANSMPINRAQARAAMSELEALSVKVTSATGSLVAALDGLDTNIGDISPDNHPTAAMLCLRTLYSQYFPRIEMGVDTRKDEWLFVSTGKHQLLTCGMPAAYPFEYSTHGHPDLGSFVWGYNRRAVLVDAGRSSYISDETTRMQCGPMGHNVMTVNGLSPLSESLLTNGYWRPRPYAKAAVDLEHRSAKGFVVKHDGFSRIPGVKVQTRTVQMTSEGIEILDTLEGSGTVVIDMYWHFAPGVSALHGSPNVATGTDFQILLGEECVETADVHWEEYPYATAYGDVQKAYMLHSKHSVSLPWSMRTTMKVKQCAE